MNGVSIQISHDDARVRAALLGLIGLGQNPAPVMRRLAEYGETSTRERFETETGPDGQKWKKSLRAELTGTKTLTKSGHLGNSITSDAGRDWAAWGTNWLYARIHQLGGVIKPVFKQFLRFKLAGGGFVSVKEVTMPPRPYLGVNQEDESEMLSLIHNRLRGAAHVG